ncbi:MAG: formylglycine-generating enzyme family protein [Smithella sp.]|nr:formylglycine-generating enzyme family protein [Smithella sp.]
MRRKSILLVLLFFLAVCAAHAAELKNEKARQEGNRLVITYDLEGKENEAQVNLILTVDGKTCKASDLHVEGDVGKVRTGRGKRISWNILQDFPRGLRSGVDWELTTAGEAFTDSVTGMEMVFVKGGCYRMGDTFGDGYADEKPVHEVCVNDFYMGKHEVTVGQFRKFVQDTNYRTEAEKGDGCYIWTGTKWVKQRDKNWRNPGFSQRDNHPVVCVSWNDAKKFSEWQTRKSGKDYRLPTEAEWEYAARSGGKSEKYAGGNDVDAVAWYSKNSGSETHPVGQKRPNGLGLYDMSGNVREWCSDWYGEKYYSQSPRDNPDGPSSGSYRVLRGGSWVYIPRNVRAADRGWYIPEIRNNYFGFRMALSAR